MLTILCKQNEEVHGLSKACDRNQLCNQYLQRGGGGGGVGVNERKFINQIGDKMTHKEKVFLLCYICKHHFICEST